MYNEDLVVVTHPFMRCAIRDFEANYDAVMCHSRTESPHLMAQLADVECHVVETQDQTLLWEIFLAGDSSLDI